MEMFLLFCLVVVLVVRWIYLRNRLRELEERIDDLQRVVRSVPATSAPAPEHREAEPRPVAPPAPAPSAPVEPANVPLPARLSPMPPPVEAAAPAARINWEETVGANWLNKAGVVLLVIGLALALAYSFTHIGPLGRVAISLAVSLVMLAAGVVFEPREPYRVFARGLLGGGWAALYTTVYAMHAVPAALVIPSALAGTVLLLAVAGGMILHSLRYRSPAVSGLAYFIAFGTLAIAEVNTLAVVALIPLAASLLYVAHRFSWSRMALFGLVATYGVVIARGDHGAPLAPAQALFAIFWLVFEAYDILHPEAWLLPLNAAGFLGLSLLKWNAAAPHDIWMLLACSAAAYLASTVARWRAGSWHLAATLCAALAAASVFQRLDHAWIAPALLVEAELVYLAGVRARAPFLRWLGAGVFAVQVGRLLAVDTASLSTHTWSSVALVDAVVFYANRALMTADVFFGFAGAGMLAVFVGAEAPVHDRSLAWLFLSAGTLAIGGWRRLRDFRLQGYMLGILGLLAVSTEVQSNLPALWGALVFSYAVALWAPRLPEEERGPIRYVCAGAATLCGLALAWRLSPGPWLALVWMALSLLLLELGIRSLPADFRWHAYGVAAIGFLRCWAVNFGGHTQPVLNAAGGAACLFAAGFRSARTAPARPYYSLLGAGLIALLLGYEGSGSVLTVAWGVEGVALLGAGFPLRDRVLRLAGLGLLLFCILKLFLWDLRHLDTLPRIFSFLVLGLILVGVSWVYTRFREHF